MSNARRQGRGCFSTRRFWCRRAAPEPFQAAVRRHAGALEGAGISVSLTGPWPPYNFI